MTTPTNPGDAITRAASRIASTKDSARKLSEEIAEQRKAPPEGEQPSQGAPTP